MNQTNETEEQTEQQEMILTENTQTRRAIEGELGIDLNYVTFSSQYGKYKLKMQKNEYITDAMYMQALVHIEAIGKNTSGGSIPPSDIYDEMKGKFGQTIKGFYCKKNSNVAQEHIESYGICLSKINDFNELYETKILAILEVLQNKIKEEKDESEAWRKAKKENASRKKYREITEKAKRMFEVGKEYAINDVFNMLLDDILIEARRIERERIETEGNNENE